MSSILVDIQMDMFGIARFSYRSTRIIIVVNVTIQLVTYCHQARFNLRGKVIDDTFPISIHAE